MYSLGAASTSISICIDFEVHPQAYPLATAIHLPQNPHIHWQHTHLQLNPQVYALEASSASLPCVCACRLRVWALHCDLWVLLVSCLSRTSHTDAPLLAFFPGFSEIRRAHGYWHGNSRRLCPSIYFWRKLSLVCFITRRCDYAGARSQIGRVVYHPTSLAL